MLNELHFHVSYGPSAPLLCTIALCIGAWVGLRGSAARNRAAVGSAFAPEAAARRPWLRAAGARNAPDAGDSTIGSFLLILALGWGLAFGVAHALEAYRAFVVEAFTLPAGLLRAMILTPMLLIVMGVAFFGSAALATLLSAAPIHQRLLRDAALLASGAAGSILALLVQREGALLALTLVPLFASAALAATHGAPNAPVDARAAARLCSAARTSTAVIAIGLALPNAIRIAAHPGSAVSAAAAWPIDSAFGTAITIRPEESASLVHLDGADRPLTDIDIQSKRFDALLIRTSPRFTSTRRDVERFIDRCAAAIRPGGRLLLELPAEGVVGPVLRLPQRRGTLPGAAFYALSLTDGSRTLLFGSDVSAWIARRMAAGTAYALDPVAGKEDMPCTPNAARPP